MRVADPRHIPSRLISPYFPPHLTYRSPHMSSTLSLATTSPRILPDLSQKDAEIAALRAEIEALKSASSSKLTLRVSEKGALCIYGLGRFPFTFYISQWRRIRENLATIDAFVAANATRFVTKD